MQLKKPLKNYGLKDWNAIDNLIGLIEKAVPKDKEENSKEGFWIV